MNARLDIYHHEDPRVIPLLEEILERLKHLQRQEAIAMAAIDDDLAALTAEVTNLTTVDASAVAALNGIGKIVSDAVAAALAAGATPAQLQAVTDAVAAIKAQNAALAAAVTANVPPVPTSPTA